MNIKQAKEQVIQTVRAYLKKDVHGDWAIPPVAQRPILLMGPPGVGKTAIAQPSACPASAPQPTVTRPSPSLSTP